jgi:hypothetical protein
MDKYERFRSRARAERCLTLTGGGSLWGFENWSSEGKEDHHTARKKYGDATILVPISMHRELTRRQMEEHPAEGPDPANPLEREGRFFLGLADILECLADTLRWIGESLIEAAKCGERNPKESAEIPEYLVPLLFLAGKFLIETADGLAGGPKE